MDTEPFVVHLPFNWKAAKKHAEYKSKCGKMVKKPPFCEVRRASGYGWYFLCGPHERYYQRCPDCEMRR